MRLKQIQIVILLGVFLLQYFFEHIYPQQKNINNWKNEKFNIITGLLNMAITFVPAYFLIQWVFLIQQKNLGLLQLLVLPFWINLGLSIFLLDLLIYTWHRPTTKFSFF